MIKLYYYPNNASLAPHLLLHHVNADFELVLVDRDSNFHKSPEYLRLNPAGLIPTLVVDDQAIFESPAICIHICELHAQYELMPAIGDSKRPLFFQWLAFLNNTLQAELMVRIYPQRHTTDESAVQGIIAAQDQRIGATLSIINDQLEHNPYLLGDKLSACDYFLFMLAEWSLRVTPSPLSFEHLAKYLNRMANNETVKTVCAFEDMDLSPFSTIKV